ncbi:hypothetical protein B0H14DRAFT_2201206, partial [Mycena olivaceomarginata]
RMWEVLMCAVVGEVFAGCGTGMDNAPEICGCTISVRQSEDIILLWNCVEDVRVRERIR